MALCMHLYVNEFGERLKADASVTYLAMTVAHKVESAATPKMTKYITYICT